MGDKNYAYLTILTETLENTNNNLAKLDSECKPEFYIATNAVTCFQLALKTYKIHRKMVDEQCELVKETERLNIAVQQLKGRYKPTESKK